MNTTPTTVYPQCMTESKILYLTILRLHPMFTNNINKCTSQSVISDVHKDSHEGPTFLANFSTRATSPNLIKGVHISLIIESPQLLPCLIPTSKTSSFSCGTKDVMLCLLRGCKGMLGVTEQLEGNLQGHYIQHQYQFLLGSCL